MGTQLRTNKVLQRLMMGVWMACVMNAEAAAPKPIGKILAVEKKFRGLDARLNGKDLNFTGKASVDLYESDVLQTYAGQRVTFVFEESTEISIGSSTRLKIVNWNGKDSRGRKRRELELRAGALKAKVVKAYSKEEPFVIKTPQAMVVVRGTEFIVEAGPGGRLQQSRTLTPEEIRDRARETELHTLEGEVRFAKSGTSLSDDGEWVTVSGGFTSLIRDDMAKPQQPHLFEVAKFREYLVKGDEKEPISVSRRMTNEERSSQALNVRESNEVYYARKSNNSKGRAIASEKAAEFESRRRKFLGRTVAERKIAAEKRARFLKEREQRIHSAVSGSELPK